MENHPLQEEGRSLKNLDPCIMVIFGATGDLTGRKLLPAVYNLGKESLLPANFGCVGFARREKSEEEFRSEMEKNIDQFSRSKPIDSSFWDTFKEQIFYHQSQFDDDQGYIRLKEYLDKLDQKLKTKGNRVFYLSVQPKFFPLIIEKLHKNGLIYPQDDERWSRVVIEKPFGKDLNSASELQNNIQQYLNEKQIYRIDHYLGKETVQNLLVFRFSNSIFESIWNAQNIDNVQITVAESIGIEGRGDFYEEEGFSRDIIQNHMMQLLSLVAMEPPANLEGDSIRDEKVKVIQCIRHFKDDDFETSMARGQYGKGFVDGENAIPYREEPEVDKNSNRETFACFKFHIDNWRWSGVPFYLRGGKRLPKRATEIAITFKKAPGVLFPDGLDSNVMAIRIQPDEGIALKMNCKVPGPSSPIQPVKMDFRYNSYFGKAPPEAYERLIYDCMLGDSTLFARADEVLESWKIFTPILEYWEKNPPQNFPNYESGVWGPKEAEDMIERDNRKWRIL